MRHSDREHSGLAPILLRIPVPWVFALTYIIGAALEGAFHFGAFLPESAYLSPAGLVILLVGIAFAGWGWIIFRRAGTTRVPGEHSTTLVTSGPYRFTRNPMYVGLSVAYIGEAAILHHIAPLVLLPLTIAYLNGVVIPVEEQRLAALFGAEYERYKTRVRRWL